VSEGTTGSERRGPRRRWVRIAVLAVLGAVAVAAAGMLVWALTPLGPGDAALAALASGDGVTVSRTDDGWVFVPDRPDGVLETGLVFYPGGRVDARSYAPFARELARAGHAVVIVEVPLSLAVFEIDAAEGVLAAQDLAAVERWAVGGHSLGGAMAATYAADAPERVDGLLLLAAYATSSADLRTSGLAVTDVTGSLDGVLDRENWEAGRALLPTGAVYVSIEGGNHAQFGDYGPQPGDNEATIDASDQLRRAVEAADALLDRL